MLASTEGKLYEPRARELLAHCVLCTCSQDAVSSYPDSGQSCGVLSGSRLDTLLSKLSCAALALWPSASSMQPRGAYCTADFAAM